MTELDLGRVDPPYKRFLELGREACANHPRHLLALDAIAAARLIADERSYSAAELTWLQIDYLEAAGIGTDPHDDCFVPITRPTVARPEMT